MFFYSKSLALGFSSNLCEKYIIAYCCLFEHLYVKQTLSKSEFLSDPVLVIAVGLLIDCHRLFIANFTD